jgi:metallo-beta-lactamase family protein
VIIPAFALGRVEEILYWIDLLEQRGDIPKLPVHVDSPMAADVLTKYVNRSGELDGNHRFRTAKLNVVGTIAESRAIQEASGEAIVIASSGMATGGRVLHHLFHGLPDPRNTVLFAGYQAAGTRGRQLKDGASFVRIHGQSVPVRAEIDALDSMSAHADAGEIMRWLGGFTQPPALTCLVHGEPGPMDALKARIERDLRWTVKTPGHQERIEV